MFPGSWFSTIAWGRSKTNRSASSGPTHLAAASRPSASRGAMMVVMGIRGQEVHQAVIQETFRPVLGLIAKTPGNRPGGHLDPGPLTRRLHEPAVMLVIQPGQALRVRNDRYKACGQGIEDRIQKARRHRVMGRLEEKVT